MGKSEPIYFCENVSTIEFRDGLFYLTDDCGDFRLTRAMRPSTFFRCVRGAMALVVQFEQANSNVCCMGGD